MISGNVWNKECEWDFMKNCEARDVTMHLDNFLDVSQKMGIGKHLKLPAKV